MNDGLVVKAGRLTKKLHAYVTISEKTEKGIPKYVEMTLKFKDDAELRRYIRKLETVDM